MRQPLKCTKCTHLSRTRTDVRALPLTGGRDVASGELREGEGVLAGQELFLPRLDRLLPRRGERLHDAVDERADVRLGLRDPFRRGKDGVGSSI